jgi:hypothetical protein
MDSQSKCSCKDNSNGFATSYWGPCLWYILKFFCALSTETGTDDEYDTFLLNCGVLMPCSFCRHHFECIFKSTVNLTSQKHRIQALQNLHNLVSLKVEDTIHDPIDLETFKKRFSSRKTLAFACKFFFSAVILNETSRTSGENHKMDKEEYQRRTQQALAFIEKKLHFCSNLSVDSNLCPPGSQVRSSAFDVGTFELFRAKRDLNHCFVAVAEHVVQNLPPLSNAAEE